MTFTLISIRYNTSESAQCMYPSLFRVVFSIAVILQFYQAIFAVGTCEIVLCSSILGSYYSFPLKNSNSKPSSFFVKYHFAKWEQTWENKATATTTPHLEEESCRSFWSKGLQSSDLHTKWCNKSPHFARLLSDVMPDSRTEGERDIICCRDCIHLGCTFQKSEIP